MTKRIYSWLLAFLLVSLASCGRSGELVTDTSMETIGSTVPEAEMVSSGNVPVQQSDREAISWEDTHLEKGSLKYTVNDAWVTDSMSGLEESRFPNYDAYAIIFRPEWEEAFLNNPEMYRDRFMMTYSPPELWSGTGQFVEGIRMVMLDITVENQDATNQYSDSNGNLVGRYADPYVFNVTSIGVLLDTGRCMEQDPDVYWRYSIGYFSGLGDRQENPFAYRVEPGQSVTFQVGYLLGNYPDGKTANASDLVLARSSSDRILGDHCVSLNLEEPPVYSQ